MEAGRMRALIVNNQVLPQNLYAFLEHYRLLSSLFRQHAYRTEMAVAGTADVIVLDIMLPGMDGTAVCRALGRHVDPTPILW